MKAIVEMLQAVQTVFMITLKEFGVHKMSRTFKEKAMYQMTGATLLSVVLQPFEESFFSINIMIVNYCATAVKMHIDEKGHIPQDCQIPSCFFTGSPLIFNWWFRLLISVALNYKDAT